MRFQVILHSARLQSPVRRIEYARQNDAVVHYYGNVPDQLTEEDRDTIPSLCGDPVKRLQFVGLNFFTFQNEDRKFVREFDIVLPDGQRFSYPRDLPPSVLQQIEPGVLQEGSAAHRVTAGAARGGDGVDP